MRTLDGLLYTFNGLGEYWLMLTNNSDFTLQGRTARARDAAGADIDTATIWEGLVAKDNDTAAAVQIELNDDRTSKLNLKAGEGSSV